MAGDKRDLSGKMSGRLIPKRGQVKVSALTVLIHSFSSIFSLHARCAGAELA